MVKISSFLVGDLPFKWLFAASLFFSAARVRDGWRKVKRKHGIGVPWQLALANNLGLFAGMAGGAMLVTLEVLTCTGRQKEDMCPYDNMLMAAQGSYPYRLKAISHILTMSGAMSSGLPFLALWAMRFHQKSPASMSQAALRIFLKALQLASMLLWVVLPAAYFVYAIRLATVQQRAEFTFDNSFFEVVPLVAGLSLFALSVHLSGERRSARIALLMAATVFGEDLENYNPFPVVTGIFMQSVFCTYNLGRDQAFCSTPEMQVPFTLAGDHVFKAMFVLSIVLSSLMLMRGWKRQSASGMSLLPWKLLWPIHVYLGCGMGIGVWQMCDGFNDCPWEVASVTDTLNLWFWFRMARDLLTHAGAMGAGLPFLALADARQGRLTAVRHRMYVCVALFVFVFLPFLYVACAYFLATPGAREQFLYSNPYFNVYPLISGLLVLTIAVLRAGERRVVITAFALFAFVSFRFTPWFVHNTRGHFMYNVLQQFLVPSGYYLLWLPFLRPTRPRTKKKRDE